jgi:hypothetical protein
VPKNALTEALPSGDTLAAQSLNREGSHTLDHSSVISLTALR